jgi:hypothetical protein
MILAALDRIWAVQATQKLEVQVEAGGGSLLDFAATGQRLRK